MDICHQPWHQISPSVFQRIESTCHYYSSADGAITHHLPSNCLKKYEESRHKNAQMSIPSWKCSIDDIIESLALFFFSDYPMLILVSLLHWSPEPCSLSALPVLSTRMYACMWAGSEELVCGSTCPTPLKTLSMSPLFWSTKTGSMGLWCPCLCTKKKHAAWQLSSAPQDVRP